MDMIEFFVDEYKEENWTAYANNFDEVNIHIEGIQQDIVNAVVGLLGDDTGYNWLHAPLINGKNALDLLKTKKGEQALKAFIMRLPT